MRYDLEGKKVLSTINTALFDCNNLKKIWVLDYWTLELNYSLFSKSIRFREGILGNYFINIFWLLRETCNFLELYGKEYRVVSVIV